MKKKLLKLIFLTAVLLSSSKTFPQEGNISKIKSNIQSKKSDTIKIDLKEKTIIPIKVKEDATLIMVKETLEPDYWKYIIPVFTLFLGIFANRVIDFFTNRKKIKRTGRRWIAELISLEENLKSQKAALENFNASFTDNSFEIPDLKIYEALDGKNFDSMDKAELLQYVEFKYGNWKPNIIISEEEANKNYKEYVLTTNRVASYTEVLKFNFDLIKEKYNSYLNGISVNTTILNKLLQDFRDQLSQYHIEIEQEPGFNFDTDPRLKPLNEIFKREFIDKKLKGESINPFLLPENLCKPVLLILAVTRDDLRTNSLRLSCNAILNTVEAFKAEQSYIKTNFSKLIDRYQKFRDELPETISLLTSVKTDS
ncbi:hypothetical protein [Flavobacterium olei]|uniref:hypothetical protein n=1 Tax=Flavobacterium olei TaxID=1886782 RepID=UPI00321BE576